MSAADRALGFVRASLIPLERAYRGLSVLEFYARRSRPPAPGAKTIREAVRTLLHVVRLVESTVPRIAVGIAVGRMEPVSRDIKFAIYRIHYVRIISERGIYPYISEYTVPESVKKELYIEIENVIRNLNRAYELLSIAERELRQRGD